MISIVAPPVRRLGQVQVPGDPRGLRCRPKLQEASDDLLTPPDHGGQSGKLLQKGVRIRERRNAGQPAVPHHIYCGGGRSRPALGNGLVDEAEEKGETGQEGRHQSEIFYADDGTVVSSDPTWIQGAFTALVAIFDRVGLMTNVGKTVSMVFQPCQAGAGNRTEEAYGRRITGEGRSYAERQRERVACGECG